MADFSEDSLAWDLRLFYAMVAGRLMISIERSTEVNNYPGMLKDLRNLFPIAFSRIDKDRDAYKKLYETQVAKIDQLANKYQTCFFGRSRDPKEVYQIEEELRTLKHFIYRILHLTKQFGSNSYIKGLG